MERKKGVKICLFFIIYDVLKQIKWLSTQEHSCKSHMLYVYSPSHYSNESVLCPRFPDSVQRDY